MAVKLLRVSSKLRKAIDGAFGERDHLECQKSSGSARHTHDRAGFVPKHRYVRYSPEITRSTSIFAKTAHGKEPGEWLVLVEKLHVF